MIKKRPGTPREVAAFALFSMREDDAWSDGALHHYLERATLSVRDTALATRLVYGVIQSRAMLDFYLSRYSSLRLKKIAPRVLECLRIGVYQLTQMERIPAHAAVGETVSLIEKYAHANPRTVGFANGLLRAISRAVEMNELPVLNCATKEEYFALRYSHLEWLVRRWSEELGLKEAGKLCEANNATTPLSLRVNLLKTTRADAIAILDDAGFIPQAHETIENIILCAGGDIASLSLFQSGEVTVQDGASVVCVDVLDPAMNAFVIDCCAAPGGKSFYIAEHMKNTGKVVALDVYQHKLDKINEGACRMGLTNIDARLADATQPHMEFYDKADFVLCDVPCSGLGIIRKKPEIRYKEESTLLGLPILQQKILENCAHYVKPGGTLVYSTCTVLKRENEDVVYSFLKENEEFETVPFMNPACGERTSGMVTLLPHQHSTDGFFIAKLRRKI